MLDALPVAAPKTSSSLRIARPARFGVASAAPSSVTAEAFARLSEEARPRLLAALKRVTRDAHLAEDLLQQALLRAWTHLEGFDGRRFHAWLHRIALNLAFSALRRNQLGDRPADPQSSEGLGSEIARGRGPCELAEDLEDTDRLRDAVARLPARQRRMLELRYVEGRRCLDIAKQLDTTPNTVSIVLCRTRQELRKQLAEAD